MSQSSRRESSEPGAASAAVIGFDPATRSWVTEAGAPAGFHRLPPLDGRVTADQAACALYADDFGHLVHRTPGAVVLPGSVQDVVKVVRFARAHGLRIAPRGRGHTTFGQAQVEAGVLLDMRSLAEIHEIAPGHADVDAGVSWRDLLAATTAVGLTPPVLTDFIELTVGGTLSAGGIGGTTYRRGAQIDQVLELQVVTGEGELVTCSPTQHEALFHAALGGMGLCSILVRARIRLIPAKRIARTHRCFHPDVRAALADLRTLVAEERFDHVCGYGQPSPSGWSWRVEGTSFFTPGDESNAGDPEARPLPAQPFAGLRHVPGSEQTEDRPYFDYCDLVAQLAKQLDALGFGGLPHPWLDLFVPGSKVDDFASETVAGLDPPGLAPGSFILIYPVVRSRLTRPLLRVPDEDMSFLFDLLVTAPDAGAAKAVLARNRALYEKACAVGSTQYVISTVEMTAEDWRRHFQSQWGLLEGEKRRHDPDNVLGAGVSILA